MQSRLHFFWWVAESHEDALWGEAFPVQQMQKSLQGQKKPDEPFKNPHELDLIKTIMMIMVIIRLQ